MRRRSGVSSCLRMAIGVLSTLLLAVVGAHGSPSDGRGEPLLRFPDIHGDTVVFVHAEDIWSAPAAGGPARRLTLDEGEERFPKLSPDGSLIAFTAEMDGNADVYVMNVDGSNVRRLTYHPWPEEVVGWNPKSNKILFSSYRHSYRYFLRLYLISPDGSGLEELPLHEAARGSFSPDGKKLVYNRIAREHRTWKRYRGGTAQDLWLYEFGSAKDRRLTDFEGTDRIPMWIGDSIYFSSDRDGVLNIWSIDPRSGTAQQITHHRDYDVRRPSSDGTSIVYELGGRIWHLDPRTGETHPITVQISPDPRDARPYLADVTDRMTSVASSPEGARALIVARGDIFTVPREHGPTRNLTRSSGARDKDAVWSPDGARVAFMSDRSGEYEVWVVDAKGLEQPDQLTHSQGGYRHTLRWSPDGAKLAFADQTLSVFILDVASKKVTRVDTAEREPMDVSRDAKPISDFAWSPDSQWLAYSKMNTDMVSHVWIYSVADGSRHDVSQGLFNDFDPVFSRDGEHLFFVSNRRFDPTFCDFEWEMVYKKVAGVYSLILRREGPPLLPPQSDEPKVGAEKEKGGGEGPAGPPVVKIDFEGIANRLEPLPLPRGNYRQLAAGDDALYYLDADAGDFNRFEYRTPGPFKVKSFSFQKRKEDVVLDEVDDYALSPDATWLVYRKKKAVGMKRLGGPKAMLARMATKANNGKPATLDLSGLKMQLDPRAEWRQIFWEAWRMERDFFYDPGMHGLDWKGMGDKYGRLLEGASCPQDLTYLMGELISELGTSHTYVGGRDLRRRVERVPVGMLGADYDLDPRANRYRFAKIYRVPEWTDVTVPPLARPGVNVKEGDYLLEVNGRQVIADREIYGYFQNLAGTQVELTINDRPVSEGARTVTVVPLRSEGTLRYLDWVEHNRLLADRASDGQIGYIHLPDTYLGSARIFPAYFYSQTEKKGLIIDGRFNGGGLDPDIFLQRLAKKPLSFWTRRYSHDQVTPWMLTRAHLVCLTDRHAGSGGDELPLEFRAKGLGPVIGTRTWGGLVGVSMFIDMIDGGYLTAPDYRTYTLQGSWTVENRGVVPDIEVWLDPAEMARGHDAQLEKAIEVLLDAIKKDPRPWPQHPPFPESQPMN
ncbi:MAG: PDZ domain-containing protein [Acidobacteria bacterium]|nr:PDZ domain-containing protein [Acidobacteriota bacterium]